jgi:hypothetical protein
MAKPQYFYTVHKITDWEWHVIKVHRALRIEEGFYAVTRNRGRMSCECLAGGSHTCRHREMIEEFTKSHKLGSGKLYNYEQKEWVNE